VNEADGEMREAKAVTGIDRGEAGGEDSAHVRKGRGGEGDYLLAAIGPRLAGRLDTPVRRRWPKASSKTRNWVQSTGGSAGSGWSPLGGVAVSGQRPARAVNERG
jgi:hypothetical protein